MKPAGRNRGDFHNFLLLRSLTLYGGGNSGGVSGSVPVEFFIFAILLLVNALMAIAMLLASRSLGQPRMAALLACAFGGNVLLYITNAAYFYAFKGNVWIQLLVDLTAMFPVIFAASAYRLRSGLPLRLPVLLGFLVLSMGLVAWFGIVDPNRGLQASIVPFYAAGVLLFGTTALLRPGRKLLLGERPIIVTIVIMAGLEAIGGAVLVAMGNQDAPALKHAYMLIVFLGLPATTVGSGVFSLYLLAGDLAERLRRAADTDSLTGAPNRRAINANGMRMMAEACASGRPLTIAICDVDNFKDINDLHGHGYGDEVLCRVTALFRSELAAGDHFGRFGGEEFIIFFPDTGIEAAHRRVEALRARIMGLQMADMVPPLTASFGIAMMRSDDHLLADIVKRADRALYASKEAGRNRTTIDGQVEAAE